MSHPNTWYITENKTATVSPAVHLLKTCASCTLDQCVSALSAALFGTSLATTASFYRVHQAAGLRNAAVPLLGVLCNSSHQLQLDRWQADPKRTP